MSMLEQRIQQQFFESADLQVQVAEALSRPIAEAAQTVLGCLTAGGKLLLCGSGASAAMAQHVAALLVGRFERTRPGLAAIAIGADASVLAALAERGVPQQMLATQVQALGAPGDVLLVLTANGEPATLLAATQAAQARDMAVVAFTGREAPQLARMLGETDVHVAVPHDRAARVQEVHLLALHCLCDAVDLQLMGEQDNA